MEHQSLITSGFDGSSVVMKQEPKDSCSQTVDNHSTDGSVVIKQESEKNCSQTRNMKLDISSINITSIVGNVADQCQTRAVPPMEQESEDKKCDDHGISTAPSERCDQYSKICDVPKSIKIERCVSLNTDISQCDDTASKLMEVSGEMKIERCVSLNTNISESDDTASELMEVSGEMKIERCVSLNTNISQSDDTASELMEVSGEIDCKANIMDGIDGIDGMPKDAQSQTDEERGRTACHQSDNLESSENVERDGK